jgi:cytochrome c oxidase subunit IV
MSRLMPVSFDVEAYEYVMVVGIISYSTSNAQWKPLTAIDVQRLNGNTLCVRMSTGGPHRNQRFFEVDMEDITSELDRSNRDPVYLHKTLLSRTSPYIMIVRKFQRVTLVVTLDYQILHGVGTSSWSLVKVIATGLSGAIIHTMDFAKTFSEKLSYSVILPYGLVLCFTVFVSATCHFSLVQVNSATSKDCNPDQETYGEKQQNAPVRHHSFLEYARQWIVV